MPAIHPMYFVKTPFYLKRVFGSMTWELPAYTAPQNATAAAGAAPASSPASTPDAPSADAASGEGQPTLYLTFDDGPTPGVTEFVLDQLKHYGATATFFLVGSQAEKHPELVERMRAEGHAVGHHSYSHLNGWKTSDDAYLEDVQRAAKIVGGPLFRPPFGRIKITQIEALKRDHHIVMWDVISGDFDQSITEQQCLDNVLSNAKAGSIVVMHDSTKAEDKVRYALPKVLERFAQKGYAFSAVPAEAPLEA
jgi:peptidoglycan/xylan/chitin deacetylase (PgdA/CDA1 family)